MYEVKHEVQNHEFEVIEMFFKPCCDGIGLQPDSVEEVAVVLWPVQRFQDVA